MKSIELNRKRYGKKSFGSRRSDMNSGGLSDGEWRNQSVAETRMHVELYHTFYS